ATVLGVGLLLGACASPVAKASAPVAPAATHVTDSLPATPAVQATPPTPAAKAVPVVRVAPVVQVAPVSTPPVAPAVASAPPVATTPPSDTTPPSMPRPSVTTAAAGSAPHFTTPDDAMRYLVAAYNSHDTTAEMHVTTPDARAQLEAERQWVNTFSFAGCQVDGTQGDYICTFDMAAKVATASAGADATGTQMGEITVIVAPASRPGWYMYTSEGCGG
ncbi:MAG TPA: hypothetical protein VII50_06695, partial [Acidothermaceae bacterium]